MNTEFKNFKISRGLSTELFDANGNIRPNILIEKGCWYLCIDTAELYVAVEDSHGNVGLKRINTAQLEEELAELRTELQQVSEAILTELRALDSVELFKRISDEGDLPTDFDAADFNPNVTYYIPVTDDAGNPTGNISTYIYDKESRSYFCTQSIDELMPDTLPETIKETLKTVILHGGTASC